MLHDFVFNFSVEVENKQKKLGTHLKKSKNEYLFIVKNKLRLKTHALILPRFNQIIFG